MKKKTLKEKIDRVCWWAAGLTILYFILGAFLKSDGPKFDPNKTYELIKDTLTLTATFLAPVAAFVLFSDWREQHKAQKLELDSENILKKIYDAQLILLSLMNTVCSGEKDDMVINQNAFKLKNEIILITKSIMHDSYRLKKLCGRDLIFIMKAIEIAKLINNGSDQLYELQCAYQKSDDDYCPNIDFMKPIFSKLENNMDQINEIALNLQI